MGNTSSQPLGPSQIVPDEVRWKLEDTRDARAGSPHGSEIAVANPRSKMMPPTPDATQALISKKRRRKETSPAATADGSEKVKVKKPKKSRGRPRDPSLLVREVTLDSADQEALASQLGQTLDGAVEGRERPRKTARRTEDTGATQGAPVIEPAVVQEDDAKVEPAPMNGAGESPAEVAPKKTKKRKKTQISVVVPVDATPAQASPAAVQLPDPVAQPAGIANVPEPQALASNDMIGRTDMSPLEKTKRRKGKKQNVAVEPESAEVPSAAPKAEEVTPSETPAEKLKKRSKKAQRTTEAAVPEDAPTSVAVRSTNPGNGGDAEEAAADLEHAVIVPEKKAKKRKVKVKPEATDEEVADTQLDGIAHPQSAGREPVPDESAQLDSKPTQESWAEDVWAVTTQQPDEASETAPAPLERGRKRRRSVAVQPAEEGSAMERDETQAQEGATQTAADERPVKKPKKRKKQSKLQLAVQDDLNAEPPANREPSLQDGVAEMSGPDQIAVADAAVEAAPMEGKKRKKKAKERPIEVAKEGLVAERSKTLSAPKRPLQAYIVDGSGSEQPVATETANEAAPTERMKRKKKPKAHPAGDSDDVVAAESHQTRPSPAVVVQASEMSLTEQHEMEAIPNQQNKRKRKSKQARGSISNKAYAEIKASEEKVFSPSLDDDDEPDVSQSDDGQSVADSMSHRVPQVTGNVGKKDHDHSGPARLPDPVNQGPEGGRFEKVEEDAADAVFDWICETHDISRHDLKCAITDKWRDGLPPDFKSEIERVLPNRTRVAVRKMCQRRYAVKQQGPWTKEEDQLLLNAYAEHGAIWKKVADLVPGRAPDQCRDRHRLHLQYGEDRQTGPWDQEEEAKLVRVVKKCMKKITKAHQQRQIDGDDVETMIAWNIVADKMGRQRSTKRCMEKWRKLRRQNPGLLYTKKHELSDEPAVAVRLWTEETKNTSNAAAVKAYESFKPADLYDVLVEIHTAIPDHRKVYGHEDTIWMMVSQKNIATRFTSALRRKAYHEAVTEYAEEPDVQAATTIAGKAKAMADYLERWGEENPVEFGERGYMATGTPKRHRRTKVTIPTETPKKRKKNKMEKNDSGVENTDLARSGQKAKKRKLHPPKTIERSDGLTPQRSRKKQYLSAERIENSDEEDDNVATLPVQTVESSDDDGGNGDKVRAQTVEGTDDEELDAVKLPSSPPGQRAQEEVDEAPHRTWRSEGKRPAGADAAPQSQASSDSDSSDSDSSDIDTSDSDSSDEDGSDVPSSDPPPYDEINQREEAGTPSPTTTGQPTHTLAPEQHAERVDYDIDVSSLPSGGGSMSPAIMGRPRFSQLLTGAGRRRR